jgi:hypothetical protein
MANSLTTSVSVSALMGSLSIPFSASFTKTPTSNVTLATRQTLPLVSGGTAEALVKGEITTIGVLAIKNEDALYNVTLYNQSTIAGAVAICTLAPGEVNLISVNTANIYAAIASVIGDITFLLIPADA